MKKIVITRKKKFAGAMMPYWIVFKKSKAEFMSEFGFEGDACNMSEAGFPIARLDVEELDRIGTRIMNGQTVELELTDDISGLFVSTMDGYLSDEVLIDEYINSGKSVTINTKGGFKELSHPVIE